MLAQVLVRIQFRQAYIDKVSQPGVIRLLHLLRRQLVEPLRLVLLEFSADACLVQIGIGFLPGVPVPAEIIAGDVDEAVRPFTHFHIRPVSPLNVMPRPI